MDDLGLNGFDFLEFGLLTIRVLLVLYKTRRRGEFCHPRFISHIEGSLKFLKRQSRRALWALQNDALIARFADVLMEPLQDIVHGRLRVLRCREVAGTSTGRQHSA